ncbi:hypothetical protein [Paraburkholderia megapolitana]|uniref:Uncharacterized protein n=1 Tax=Paraburkholderia megapolitana TaxID=420953 RepID=A0A1I3JIT7_9BURK|nr:hypothetical protein [Paraburkholderia megapolitana]QDQ84780.1 hypothetical protein FNZ07_27355 [Paraburkholderia megapolitana]SFI60183.1 hypothetical protein SAMN05192543_103727 [Paraburkholderia megapolitana]
MNWDRIFAKMFDQYELNARLLPGLLLLLPPITYLTLLYGATNPIVVGLSSVLATCGGPYFLSSFVRTWGLRAQNRLYRRWDGQPSTLLLRHRDTYLPQQTKLRYHSLVALRLGVAIPSLEEEKQHPVQADEAYMAAADALRPLTNDRKRFPFIFKELVAYGFNRNAYGSRWVGLCVAVATLIASAFHGGILRLQTPYLSSSGLDLAHSLVFLVSLGLSALWCLHFTADTAWFAGVCYAKRLWEALEELSKKPARPPSDAQELRRTHGNLS